MDNTVGIVILAAGMGKRMKSDKAKVLHEVVGRPMIEYVVDAAVQVAGPNVVLVVGHQAEQVRQIVSRSYNVHFAVQTEQRGTGHALLCAMPVIAGQVSSVVVLCGDVPLIRVATIGQLIAEHQTHHRDATVLAVRVSDPTGYGRVIINDNSQLTAIVEETDANEIQKKIDIVNTGAYVLEKSFLDLVLPQLDANNVQNEIYLTDIMGLGHQHQRNIGAMIGSDPEEFLGVNSSAELSIAEKLMKIRTCEKS